MFSVFVNHKYHFADIFLTHKYISSHLVFVTHKYTCVTYIFVIHKYKIVLFSIDLPVSSDLAKEFGISLERSEIDESTGNVKAYVRSHSLKRNAVQTLQEYLAPHSFVARCGWVVKNIHSLYDYMFNSPSQDANAGKTVQGWKKASMDGNVLGGVPPRITAIKTASPKVRQFVNHLFRE